MGARGAQLGSSLLSFQLQLDGLATQLILPKREMVKQSDSTSLLSKCILIYSQILDRKNERDEHRTSLLLFLFLCVYN